MAATRRPGRNHLFVPGPTNIPDRVMRAMMVQSEDHRSVDFPSLTKPLFEDTKKVFGSTEARSSCSRPPAPASGNRR